MAKHTPGPWEAVSWTVFPESYGDSICTMGLYAKRADSEHEANARLIAAAPELLSVLEAFLRAPSAGSRGPGSVTLEVQSFNLDAARAAIAKATGN